MQNPNESLSMWWDNIKIELRRTNKELKNKKEELV